MICHAPDAHTAHDIKTRPTQSGTKPKQVNVNTREESDANSPNSFKGNPNTHTHAKQNKRETKKQKSGKWKV